MLTLRQQHFLIELLVNGGLQRNQQSIWKSINFYRNTSYLIKSQMIKFEEMQNGRRYKIYKLTLTGSLTARCLLRLDDLKKKYPKAYKEYRLPVV